MNDGCDLGSFIVIDLLPAPFLLQFSLEVPNFPLEFDDSRATLHARVHAQNEAVCNPHAAPYKEKYDESIIHAACNVQLEK